MTKSKTRLPLTIPLQIPTWWTQEQACAVFEMLDQLRAAIWSCYKLELRSERRDQLSPREREDPNDLPY